MNKLLVASLLAAAAANAAPWLSETQKKNYDSSGSNDFSSTMTFDQFRSRVWLELKAIEVSLDGVLSGNFKVTNNKPTGSIRTKNSSSNVSVYFVDAAAPAAVDSTALAPVLTNPVTNNSGSNVTGGTTVQFDLDAGQTQTIAVTNYDAAYFPWFVGNGTFDMIVDEIFAVAVGGTNYTLDSAGLVSTGSVTLTYYYGPIPESSTYGIALGGLALAAVAVRRRKQAAK